MMVSVNIQPMSWKNPNDRSLIRELYDRVLVDDESWHFLWEGAYAALRFQNNWATDIRDIVLSHGKEITEPVTYLDNIHITAKYQLQFVQIFHGMSELVMAMDAQENTPGEFIAVADRIVHCYFNMCIVDHRVEIMDVLNQRGQDAAAGFEPMALSYLAHLRSFTNGTIVGGARKSRPYIQAQCPECDRVDGSHHTSCSKYRRRE